MTRFDPLPGWRRLSLLPLLLLAASPLAAATDEAEVRAIVARMLAGKEAQIERLEARIRELEAQVATLRATPPPAPPAAAGTAPETAPATAAEAEPVGGETEENGLQLSGFFDVLARTENEANRPFDLGAVEVDLQYDLAGQFAVSSALVWDGGSADVAVAVMDYHLYDHSIPARGRIFAEPGFHLQAGRFDLPFAADYQYFAAPDRLTVTAPLTTERIQGGGFNGDGVRLYGSGLHYTYALFLTSAIRGDGGWSAGGRLGGRLGDNPFSLHSHSGPPLLEGGLSTLATFDGHGALADLVWAADARLNYGPFALFGEALLRDARQPRFDGNGNRLQDRDEYAWHLTLDTDLEPSSGLPLALFLRYGAWVPDYRRVVDADDPTLTWEVDNLSRLSLGLRYHFNDHLRLKFEYFDHLGNNTGEPGFDDALGLGQVVVSF